MKILKGEQVTKILNNPTEFAYAYCKGEVDKFLEEGKNK